MASRITQLWLALLAVLFTGRIVVGIRIYINSSSSPGGVLLSLGRRGRRNYTLVSLPRDRIVRELLNIDPNTGIISLTRRLQCGLPYNKLSVVAVCSISVGVPAVHFWTPVVVSLRNVRCFERGANLVSNTRSSLGTADVHENSRMVWKRRPKGFSRSGRDFLGRLYQKGVMSSSVAELSKVLRFCRESHRESFQTFQRRLESGFKLLEGGRLRVRRSSGRNNPPKFAKQIDTVSVQEDVKIGTMVIRVSASDPDPHSRGKLSYAMTPLGNINSKDFFQINSSTGQVRTSKELDRETIAEHQFRVTATDGGKTPLQGAMSLNIKVLDVNDHSPVFDKKIYRENISESVAIGWTVLAVRAHDSDMGLNKDIRYSIVNNLGENHVFTIGHVSGIVKVEEELDREQVASYKLVVKAEDQGNPPMSSTTQVFITLLDENDCSPVFNESTYDFRVEENSQRDTFVGALYATDCDVGLNKRIKYSITSGNDDQAFHMETNSGIIRVKGLLDFEKNSIYSLQVTAEDFGAPPEDSEVWVMISITDINDNPPEFLKNEYHFRVREDVDVGYNIGTVEAEDRDSEQNGDIQYFLKDRKVPFEIELGTGRLKTKEKLDRETVPNYRLEIIAEDKGKRPLRNAVTVFVTIEDVNDSPPYFILQRYNATIPEDYPRLRMFLTIIAKDQDEGGTIRYSVKNVPDNCFTINPFSGGLMRSKTCRLSYKRKREYHFKVEASDRKQMSSVDVVVTISDSNDHAPKFVQSAFSGKIYENQPTGTTVLQVNATDEDAGENARVSYSIKGGSKVFKIDPKTGIITSLVPLDRETTSTYRFRVIATDHGKRKKSGRAKVKINVEDVNDNSPKFYESNYDVSVEENVHVGTFIFQMKATDDDSGVNKQISYSFGKNGSGGGMFKINPDLGDITVNKQLDRETTPEYILTVLATDHGKPPLNSSAQIKVSLRDVIDSPPFFEKPHYVADIYEDYPIKKEVVQVKAVTRDTLHHSKMQYDITSGNHDRKFTILGTTGSIELVKPLDYESKTQYVLTIQAVYASFLATTVVEINVQDVNDEAPVLAPRFEIIINMQQGMFPQDLQLKIPASDPDKSSRLSYKVKNVPFNVLTVDKDTGILNLKELALMNTGGVTFGVEVSDGENHKTGNGSIRLHVITQKLLNSSVTVYLKNATTLKFFHSFQQFKKSIGSVLGVKDGNIIVFYVVNTSRSKWVYDEKADDDFLVTDNFLTIWMAVRHAVLEEGFLDEKLILEKLFLNVEKLERETGMIFLPSDKEIIRGKHSNHNLYVNEACAEKDSFLTCFTEKSFQNTSNNFINTPSVIFRNLKIEEVVRKKCPFGFHGSHCNSMLDSCYSSPCKNNGECINLESGYTCRCHPNFAGKNCQIEMMKSKCSRLPDNPCLNRGVCQDVPNGGFKCKCPSSEDYSDRLCRATTRSFQNGSLLAFPGITHHWHIEIALEFATINSNGLLMYIGRYEHENDFMALEIRDRRVYYIFSAGDEVETISVDSSNGDSVTNGQWNKVTISYQNQTGSLVLGYKCDSAVAVKFGKQEGTFSCAAAKRLKGRLKSMDLTSPLLLGGLPFKPDKLPIQDKSFIGCIRNVLVNQEALNLGSPILDRNTQAGCSQKRNFCLKNPCDNGGTCISSWNTAVCQCPDGFVGKTCTIKTTSLDFTHYGFLITSPKNVVVKLPWSMSVMFRTLENTGVVMEVMFSSYISYLQLQNGTLHYSYHTLSMNIPDIELNDGEWHHVNITWSVTSVRLVVDHVFSAQVKYRGDTLDGRSLALISLGDRHKSGNSLNGCMKGVMIGGAPLDITSATGSQFSNGCGSKAKCQTNVCSKGSVCKEHWRVTSCECRNGYVGQKCVDICTLQPCQNAAICNRTDDAVGFQCTCPDKYLGQFCETRSQLPCEDEYYSASDNGVCGPCNCNLGLGYDPVCNKTNGYCHCKKHHYREILKQGRLGDICIRCDCDREGSVNQMCEPIGGQCPCLPGVIGRRCDMCKEKQGEITRNGKGCKIINTSCPRAKAEDIVWQRVNFGVVAKQKCPYGAVGTAERLCAIGRGWQPPDVTDCTSTGFVDLQKLLKRYGNLTAQTAIKVTDHLGNLLFARENFFQKDVAIAYKIIMALMDFESKQDEENLASSQDNKFLDTVLGAVSTFLDKKYTTAWSLIDENTSASVSLMRHLEEFGVNLASNIVYIKRKQYRRRRSTSGLRSLNKIEPNLLMQLEPVSPQHFSGLLFPSEEHKDSLLASPEWQNRTNRVKIPSSLFRNHGAPRKESAIAFIVLKDLGDLLPNSFDINESITGFSLDVNSDVISVGIKGMESMYLKDPITIEFLNHEVNRSQYDCVFWNYSIPGGHGGGWSKNGCTKVPSNFTHTICKCHHLTSFAVVSDLRMEVPVISPYTVQIITYVGVSVSLAILLVAFLSFTCLSGLNSNTNSIHKNMVLAIVIAELVYMIGINRTSSKLLCRFVAIILHFFFDAVFAWMFVEVIHMYRRLIEKRNIDSGQMTFYYFVGWGCPAIVVGLSTGMAVEDYGNEKFCWMTTDGTLIWTFTIPIAAVIVLNTLVFLVALRLSIKKVRRKRKRQTYNPKNAPVTSVYKNTLKIKYALKVGAACLPLLGITLAFAVLAVNKDMLLFHYLFALLCCCQALFVFLFYVVFDTKVRDEYKNAFVRWKTGDKNYGRPRRKRLFELSYHPGANLAGEDGYGVRGMNPETTSTDHSTSTLHSLSMTRTSKSDPFTTFPEDDSETDFKEVKDRKPRKRDPVDMESAARMWNAPEKSEISTTQPDSSESSDEDRRRETMVISSESGSSEDESGSWEKKAAADVSKQKGTAPLYASDGPMHSTPLEQEQEKARLLNKKPTPVTPVTAVEPFPRSKRPSILKNSPLRSPASPHEALIPFKDVKYSSQPLLTTALPPKVNKNGSEASSGSSLSSSSDENMVMPAKLLSQSTEGGMSNASSKDRKRKSRKTRDKEHGKKSRHHRVHFHRPNTNTSSNTNINVDEARKVRVKALHLGEGKPLTHHDV